MRAIPRTIVGDLAHWDLPSLEDHICDLIKELRPKRIRLNVDEVTFGDLLEELLDNPVRKFGKTVANEAICGWLQGNADGCPELCTVFSYLEGDDESEPLTVAYYVGAKDGSRIEINWIDFEDALIQAVRTEEAARSRKARVTVIVSRLRTLASKLEEAAA